MSKSAPYDAQSLSEPMMIFPGDTAVISCGVTMGDPFNSDDRWRRYWIPRRPALERAFPVAVGIGRAIAAGQQKSRCQVAGMRRYRAAGSQGTAPMTLLFGDSWTWRLHFMIHHPFQLIMLLWLSRRHKFYFSEKAGSCPPGRPMTACCHKETAATLLDAGRRHSRGRGLP